MEAQMACGVVDKGWRVGWMRRQTFLVGLFDGYILHWNWYIDANS